MNSRVPIVNTNSNPALFSGSESPMSQIGDVLFPCDFSSFSIIIPLVDSGQRGYRCPMNYKTRFVYVVSVCPVKVFSVL
jgi:hypothetical protein